MIRVYGRQRELPMAIHLFFFLSFSLFSCIRLTMNRFKEKSTVHGLIIIEHFIMENIIIVVRSQITDIDGTVL